MVLPLLLSAIAPAAAGALGITATPAIASAVGAGLGGLLEGGNIESGIKAGLGAYMGGQLMGGLAGQTGASAAHAPPPRPTNAMQSFLSPSKQFLSTPIGRGSLLGAAYMAKGGGVSAHPKLAQHTEHSITTDAIAALQGRHLNPQVALARYLKRFGTAAFRDLVDKTHSGTLMRQHGKISGPGDGMNDRIPAQVPGGPNVMLSDGEFVVPADVVSGIGNGSTEAGAQALRGMMHNVRKARTGSTKQPKALDPTKYIPA